MKILMFDLEHGSQSLGSKESIAKMFGYPVLSPPTWDSFLSTLGKIYTQESVATTHKIGNLEIEESERKVVPRNGTVVDAIVVDTFSELSKKYMRQISDKEGKMKLQGWGQLKNKLDGCLEFITRIPGIVICTCHGRVQTMDDGNKLMPYIDGSSKEDISKWFDFVFYTKTVTKSGKRDYLWVTSRTEKYDHAKDRTGLLNDEIPQDYNIVMDAVNKTGWDGAKILIIGSPGSGKTLSLKTLTKGESE
jgi:hypothetical protein